MYKDFGGCILLAVVYYPGRNSPAESDSQNLLNHLFDSLKSAESLYPNCGIIVTGDFNRLDMCHLRNHFKLKQLVKFPTRGQVTLDLILTREMAYMGALACALEGRAKRESNNGRSAASASHYSAPELLSSFICC